MKKALIIFAVAATILSGCRKSSSPATSFMNTATITGQNLTMPACGAAFFIVIHGLADSTAQFNTIPASSGINLATATFPVNVKINWHHNTGSSCDTIANIITIDAASAD